MFGLPEISVSMHGFAAPAGTQPRAIIDTIAQLGVRAIAIDASINGLRPRQLSRSARRDIAAVLRRNELELSGLDLWIPPEHFTQPDTAQRAIDAVQQAIEMTAELTPIVAGRSKPILSVLLPTDLPDTARTTLSSTSQQHGVVLADHALLEGERQATPAIGVGIDPVFYLTDGQSPGKAVTRAGESLASARLCDTSAMGRCVVGAQGGKLDLKSYAGALIVSGQDWVTVDVRSLPDPITAIQRAVEAWRDAGTL